MMKYVRQFCVILGFAFAGEVLRFFIPLPVPGSIYGLLLLFLALASGLLRLEQVRETADFLVDIMPLLFIPAGAGLLVSWTALRAIWLPVLLITAAVTVLVMVATGHVTQLMLRLERRKSS